MGVLRNFNDVELEQGNVLTTKMIYDWRVREKNWRRRARYVAMEFRGNDKGTTATFAPTSGIGAKLVLMLHVCFKWFLCFADIKDAFLLVEQQECVLVKQPEWWNDESGNSSGFWVLDRCLPGQRNAASRFFDFLDAHLSGRESSPSLPSLFRHKDRNLVVLLSCG